MAQLSMISFGPLSIGIGETRLWDSENSHSIRGYEATRRAAISDIKIEFAGRKSITSQDTIPLLEDALRQLANMASEAKNTIWLDEIQTIQISSRNSRCSVQYFVGEDARFPVPWECTNAELMLKVMDLIRELESSCASASFDLRRIAAQYSMALYRG